MQNPRRPERLHLGAFIPRLQPTARRLHRFAKEGLEIANAAFPGLLGQEPCRASGPKRLSKQRKKKRCICLDLANVRFVLIPISGRQRVERIDIGRPVRGQRQRRPVGAQNGCRVRGVAKFQPVFFQILAQRLMRRTRQEQNKCRRHNIMMKTERGDLVRIHAPANPILTLDHQNLVAFPRQHRGGHQRIDARPDDQMII